MAKRPTKDDALTLAVAPIRRDALARRPGEPDAPSGRSLGMIAIELPIMAGMPAGYCSTHVETQLDGRQAFALRRIYDALIEKRAKLACGVPVQSAAAALRWLLEQIPELNDGDYFARNDREASA